MRWGPRGSAVLREKPTAALLRLLDDLRSRLRGYREKYSRLLRRSGAAEDRKGELPLAGLPEGAVFVSGGRLYLVVETGAGVNFARPWEGARQERVVLDPYSLAARFHPVVPFGTPLPDFSSKAELLDREGRVLCFNFVQARLAERAARLDEVLARRAGLRFQGLRAGLSGLTDGLHVYRLYSHVLPTPQLLERIDLPQTRQVVVLDAAEGPDYWGPGSTATDRRRSRHSVPRRRGAANGTFRGGRPRHQLEPGA